MSEQKKGSYGGPIDNPTKAQPLPPPRVDRATTGVTEGVGGVKGAGKGMKSK